MRINKSLITYQPSSGAGSGTVTSVALSAPTGFTVSGSPVTSSGTLALAFTTGYGIPPLMTGNSGKFLTTNGTTMSWVNITGTDVTGAALTEVDDTNVTCTLGGTPGTALLRAVSLTFGWTGTLAVSRGGTGSNSLQGVLIGNLTAPVTAVTGIGGQLLRANPSTGVYEFFTPAYMSNPMTTLGDIIYGNAAGAPTRLAANSTANNMYLRSVSSGIPVWGSIAGSDVTGAALTEVDDTNVTCTLGGTPANALLRSVSLTFGWTGQLSVPRGGTGAATLTGVVIGNSTGAMTAVAGTSEQLLRRNTANTAYEFFTPTFLSNPMTSLGDIIYGNAAGAPLRLGANATSTNKFLRSVNGGTPSWEEVTGFLTGSGTTNYVVKWTPSGSALGNSQIFDNGTNIGIGDASPTVFIDAYKATGGIIRIRAVDGGAFYVANSTKTGTIAAFGDAGGIIGGAADTTAMIYSGGVPLAFYVNSFERARITTSGNFGIGTNAPSWKLDVNGVIGLAGTAFAEKSGNYNVLYDGSGAASIYIGGTTANLNAYSNTIHSFQNRGGTVEFATISGDGLNVKVGRIQLPSTNYLTWGGAYGTDIPTISGTSGSGSNGFLQFYPAGSTSGVKMALRRTGQLALPSYTSSSAFTGTSVATLAVDAAGDVITIAPQQITASGTYTPTWTGLANVDSVTSFSSQYMRVGDTVTVSGWVTINATADNTPTSLSFSLPINSDTSVVNRLNGTGVAQGGGAAACLSGYGTNFGEFEVLPSVDTAINYSFHFTYRIV
jgi:hypothetical protein